MINKKTEFSGYEIYYREFPELLFSTRSDGAVFFDATHYIRNKGEPSKHTVEDFTRKFDPWIEAACDCYSLGRQDLFATAPNGHQLIDNALALPFVSYVDPAFGVYMMERIAEMLRHGIVLSDTCLLAMAKERLTKDQF